MLVNAMENQNVRLSDPNPLLASKARLLPTDYRLTTAEILYRMPDHPGVLQTFVWQAFDIAPQFPELNRFLAFWRRELDGPLHSVRVASAALLRPAELRFADGLYSMH